MVILDEVMKINKVGKIKIDKIVGEKNGYLLSEKHLIVYLYDCSIKNESLNDDNEIDLLVEQLLMEFDVAPAETIMKLEQYATIHFKKLRNNLAKLL